MSGAVDTRIDRADAIAIAKRFVAQIEDCTDQLIVAGSLRRRLAKVGDIEIVAQPKIGIEQTETVGLFGSEIKRRDVDLLDAHLTMLLDMDIVQRRHKSDGSLMGWGAKAKYFTYQGARIDLFCAVNDEPAPIAEPDRFGWILMLWTGPYKFSKQLVVARGKRTNDGRPGLLPPHIKPSEGWLTYRVSGERIETPTEQAVFDLFGLPYREPWERT